jgi:hypothetical protein
MDTNDIKKFINELLNENDCNPENSDSEKIYTKGYYLGFFQGLNTDWTDETPKKWNDNEGTNAKYLIKFLAQEKNIL